MSAKDFFLSFYSSLVELRLKQLDQAREHLAFTRASAASTISRVAKRTQGEDQGAVHGECAYWDDKIDDAQMVLEISKRDFYAQLWHESKLFFGFVLLMGVLVYLQF